MGERITKVGKFIRLCENHKSVSIVVIFGLVIIALGNLTDALEKIYGLFKPSSPPISISNTNAPVETRAKWQPPELPPNCSNIFIFFGEQYVTWPLFAAKVPPMEAGQGFPLKDMPFEFTNGYDFIDKISIRKGAVRAVAADGSKYDFPIVPYVKNNRLFVYVKVPFDNERSSISMSDSLDSQLPARWDRNYTSNAFEIVREDMLPVLQVFYKRANEIQVNGIFIVNTNDVLGSFGGNPTVIYVFGVFPTEDQKAVIKPAPLPPSMVFDMKFPNQKAIFKYPAWKHPGQYAEE